MAKCNTALKVLANIHSHVLEQNSQVEQTLTELAKNKQELSTTRQSAVECLKEKEKAMETLKEFANDQNEPIEIRVAAYRSLVTSANEQQGEQESAKEQTAQQIVDQIVKHCTDERNQQKDNQFVLYAILHLDNIRSQQPEQQATKKII